MPRAKNNKIIQLQNEKTIQKNPIIANIMKISIRLEKYIYENELMSEREAQVLLKEVESYVGECSKDPRSLQVVQKQICQLKNIMQELQAETKTETNENSTTDKIKSVTKCNPENFKPTQEIDNEINNSTQKRHNIEQKIKNKTKNKLNDKLVKINSKNIIDLYDDLDTNKSLKIKNIIDKNKTNTNTQMNASRDINKKYTHNSSVPDLPKTDVKSNVNAEMSQSILSHFENELFDDSEMYIDLTQDGNASKNISYTQKTSLNLNNTCTKEKLGKLKQDLKHFSQTKTPISNVFDITNEKMGDQNLKAVYNKNYKEFAKTLKSNKINDRTSIQKHNSTHLKIPHTNNANNDKVKNDLSWIENIKYVREITKDEIIPATFDDKFWTNCALPKNWTLDDFL